MRKMTSFCWEEESGVVGVRPKPPKSVDLVQRVDTSVRVRASRGWVVWRESMIGFSEVRVVKWADWRVAGALSLEVCKGREEEGTVC